MAMKPQRCFGRNSFVWKDNGHYQKRTALKNLFEGRICLVIESIPPLMAERTLSAGGMGAGGHCSVFEVVSFL